MLERAKCVCLAVLPVIVLTSMVAPAFAQRVTLIAVGDICLAKGVEAKMRESGGDYPFAAMKPYLKRADVVFGNLECCLATGGKAVPKKYNFRGSPMNAKPLRRAGFTVVSLANNHSLDYGTTALGETLQTIRSSGVVAVGAGMTVRSAHALRIVTVRGLRVGFLAYLGLFPSTVPLLANKPAVAMGELEAVKREVSAARRKVDVLIVSMHAGKEYTFAHAARQEAIAHQAVDAGADIVIGHHPHVVQDSEIYRGKPIYYSLGNFIFDPSPTFVREPNKPWSAMVVAILERGRAPRAELVPLRIVDRQPRLANKADSARVAALLRQ